MESEIKIRATREEIYKVFYEDEEIWIKYLREIKENLYECRIRHCQFKSYLKGTYTINGLRKKLRKMEKENNELF